MKNIRLIFGLGLLCLLFLCTKKNIPDNESYVIADTDTIAIATLRTEKADTSGIGTRLPQTILTILLAAEAATPIDSVSFSAIITELSEQLSLRSGSTWNKTNSRQLLLAASALSAHLAISPSAAGCKAYAESLYSANTKNAPALTIKPCSDSSIYNAADVLRNPAQTLSGTLSWLIATDRISADLTAQFVVDMANAPQAKTDMSTMVKGLIGAPASQTPRSSQIQKERTAIDNSKLALKYRPQATIAATIGKRQPELEALYKRYLKMHENMQGTVWATFTVRYNGTVETVDLRSRQINESDFLEVLQKSLLAFTFTAIPENVGDMVFEFPFQFAPQ